MKAKDPELALIAFKTWARSYVDLRRCRLETHRIYAAMVYGVERIQVAFKKGCRDGFYVGHGNLSDYTRTGSIVCVVTITKDGDEWELKLDL